MRNKPKVSGMDLLSTVLDMEPYMAVGIALASDVLASAVSAYTYGKNKNLDIKNGLVMMATVLAFTVWVLYGFLQASNITSFVLQISYDLLILIKAARVPLNI